MLETSGTKSGEADSAGPFSPERPDSREQPVERGREQKLEFTGFETVVVDDHRHRIELEWMLAADRIDRRASGERARDETGGDDRAPERTLRFSLGKNAVSEKRPAIDDTDAEE